MDMANKSTEAVREWTKKHPERRKEQNRKAALRYIEKNKEDPEFINHRRELNKESMKRNYHKKRAAMTEEELAEYRKKRAAEMREYRAKKKAEKLAQEAAEAEKKGTE